MELPSMNFNHCIVKVIADGQAWYLELTQPDLPFGSLPNNDIKAFALEIPFAKNSNGPAKPFLLDPANRLGDFRQEHTNVEIKGRDLMIETACIRSGTIANDTRSAYKELPQAKRLEEMQGILAKKFSNPLNIKALSFGDLNKPQDTVQYKVRYAVKNEIIEIGELNTFKIPFHNIFINADAFPEETRVHPVNYWEYEDTDQYLETITVQIPNGKSITELPKNVDLSFEGIHYTLKYTQSAPGTLQVVREIVTKRDSIPAEKFEAFRVFTEGVISAETRWVAFK
jgi:hypothetical protein